MANSNDDSEAKPTMRVIRAGGKVDSGSATMSGRAAFDERYYQELAEAAGESETATLRTALAGLSEEELYIYRREPERIIEEHEFQNITKNRVLGSLDYEIGKLNRQHSTGHSITNLAFQAVIGVGGWIVAIVLALAKCQS